MTNPAMPSPTISVALCTHNGERFIAAQLRSILSQSYRPTQLVISDDASTDATLEVVEAILAEDAKEQPQRALEVVILRNSPALGVAANFEQAIGRCTADLVALSDQDDVWVDGRLEAIVQTFRDRPEVLLVHSDAQLIDDSDAPLEHTLFETLHVSHWEKRRMLIGSAMEVLVRRNLVTGATTVFRRRLAEAALPIPPGWIHDEWLGIIAAATGTVHMDHRLLVRYRQHQNNQIGARKLNLLGKFRKLKEPRRDRNRNLHVRARELVSRLSDLEHPIDQRTLRYAWEKQEHERYRSALPSQRLLRIVPVLATSARGGYSRYGLGAQDVLRDLVQPVE